MSSLSNINCCPQHLSLLNRSSPSRLSAPIVYMMSPAVNDWSNLECHCRSRCSKLKRCHKSCSSSSSTSSKPGRPRKKQAVAEPSTDTIENNDVLLSPTKEQHESLYMESLEKSTAYQQRGTNHLRTPLSPLFPSHSLINTEMNSRKSNKSSQYNMRSSTPITTRSKQRNSDEAESPMEYQSNQQQINAQPPSSPVYSPRIILSRTVHVKEEGEELFLDNPQITINMAQAIEQMLAPTDLQPKIVLQRVSVGGL
ncbi:unnamed protein product [Rotaria socialis]|nr:unnamed protein product [Rotaria socialis]CAF3693554.1 unnamed protein product [Rotaria socialis]